MSGGFLLAGTRDGGDSSKFKENPSFTNTLSSHSSSPIYINVQVNNIRHPAIVDTGSAVTIINQQLLQKINHQKFIPSRKTHQSANNTSINIIGEIQLEIKIQGHKTYILADVATNLVADLLLGNDWIINNNVIIDTLQKQIFLTNPDRRILAQATFIRPSNEYLPVLLINQITLPPYSQQCIDVMISTRPNTDIDALFEPISTFHSKRLLLPHAVLRSRNGKCQVMIINAGDCYSTLSRNTKMGYVTLHEGENNHLILPVFPERPNDHQSRIGPVIKRKDSKLLVGSCTRISEEQRKVQSLNFACRTIEQERQNHQCYVCQKHFLSGNDLQKHLRQTCYPQEIRDQIEKLTAHVEDPAEQRRLQNILWKYGKLFDLRHPSFIKATVRHAVETGNHGPMHTPPYRVSYKDEEIQRKEIDKLLQQGVIEESTSPWSSPIVLVRKKDGSARFCIDYRKLNSITTKDAFPIPRIDDIFDHLSQAEYYTTIDFKSGYFQVSLDPKDRPKTAFSTRDQHYQFTVLPQGVTNGPPAFQRIVSQILGNTRWQYSLAYLDDVIIYSKDFDQHLTHIDDVLNRLHNANFRLNADKCHIAKTSIDYLGHRIERNSIRPNADNIRALQETPQPTTAKEAFRFVKAAEYYRKFIPKFSMIAQPLYKYAPTTKEQQSIRPKRAAISLSEEELQAFKQLKSILTDDLVLSIPDKSLPFKIQTDASKIGVGAVLMQTHPNGDLPVAYLSKKFTATQMNWPATEQECYAIIYAIQKWHKYLDGISFTIETDHKPLLPLNTKQQLNAKCERWRLKLQEYKFSIKYIKGKHNTMADYLSRSPVEPESNDEDDYVPTKSQETQTETMDTNILVAPVITRAKAKQQEREEDDHHRMNQTCDDHHRMNQSCDDHHRMNQSGDDHHQMNQSCDDQESQRNVDKSVDSACVSELQQEETQVDDTIDNIIDNRIVPFTLEQLKKLQYQDEQAKRIMANIDHHGAYCIQNDMLMKKSNNPVPFVPRGRIRSDIIKIYHDTPANGSHFGRDKTVRKIKERYFWPGMKEDITNHVKSCLPCLQNNQQRKKPPGLLKPISPPEGVWQLLAMDFHGPITPMTRNGSRYIIALTDILSKFVIAKAVRDCTAATAARFLIEEVILKYGTPKCILTDNGTHFTATMMAELFKKIGVTHLYSTPYHPMTNGQIERYNATMDSKIAALSNDNRTDWDEQLPFVTFNYNTSMHATTGQTPFELMYGRQPILPFDQQQPLVSLPDHSEYRLHLNDHLSILTEQTKNNIIQQQARYKLRYDKNREEPTYEIGDLVLLKVLNRRRKFDVRQEGPFRVIQRLAQKTYVVEHVYESTVRRQVTSDIMVKVTERRNVH